MSVFCFKSFFVFSSDKKKASWNSLEEKVQRQVIEYLTPKEKAAMSLTSKSNYAVVKSVPTEIYCLQFSPFRFSSKSEEIFVFFDEDTQNSFQFIRMDKDVRFVEKHGEVEVRDKIFKKREFREMADDCFQGWLIGTRIRTLDIRGDYNGKLPTSLEVTNFSFSDKYNRPTTAIPAWLDIIVEGAVNFWLMSDHWDKILTHRQFSNPLSTCKLTGYDGIGHEYLEGVLCRQIHLNNIRDEGSFNSLVQKWVRGGFPVTFEWLEVTSVTRPLRTERLLGDIRVQGLDGRIFEEADKDIQEKDLVEYYLVFGDNDRYGVFCGIDNYARFSVINQSLVDQIPQLHVYLSPRVVVVPKLENHEVSKIVAVEEV
ncbi:hypothetical protein GCK72_008376 [Caenorhabditis remanei]|uniref:F-box domain-containing protein n=1 Tax=Caenorhabditis remanei TaxID=31234 RepID=A0A6A5GXG6_CAERE|nr:hypothetical protein GCK72_008376 [Caenorhabditis remanei]KAF1760130.1 hypothetical protein GCK72_008376 [Caenorhabditis remanei]